VTFSLAELPALFCALADPPRFGTDVERYPAQQQRLSSLLDECRGGRLEILDLACGVGLGTFETVALVERSGHHPVRAVGVTLEPLEAWMAQHRRVPHDLRRERCLRRLAESAGGVAFLAADGCRLPLRGRFHMVLCNGLVGGEWLYREEEFRALLGECRRVLRPGGWLLLANRFHDGRRTVVGRFVALARGLGWEVSGDWQDLALRPGVGGGAAQALS
jgi:SAM-dependent methyltransferase